MTLIKSVLPLSLALALIVPGLSIAQSAMSADDMAKALGLDRPAAPARPGKPKFRAPSFEIAPTEEARTTTEQAEKSSVSVVIEFDVGSARVRPEYLPQVQQVELLLRQHPSLTLQIVGHTDATGEAGHNQVLSERRAAAVQGLLVERGVAGARLTSAGRGESEPLAGEQPLSPRNRRVEFIRTDLSR